MPVIVDHLSVKLSTGSITDTMPYSICVGKWEQTILWGYKTLFSTPLVTLVRIFHSKHWSDLAGLCK